MVIVQTEAELIGSGAGPSAPIEHIVQKIVLFSFCDVSLNKLIEFTNVLDVKTMMRKALRNHDEAAHKRGVCIITNKATATHMLSPILESKYD